MNTITSLKFGTISNAPVGLLSYYITLCYMLTSIDMYALINCC